MLIPLAIWYVVNVRQ